MNTTKICAIIIIAVALLIVAVQCREYIRTYFNISLLRIKLITYKYTLADYVFSGLMLGFLVVWFTTYTYMLAHEVRTAKEKEEVHIGQPPLHTWVISIVTLDDRNVQHLDIEKVSEYNLDNAFGKVMVLNIKRYQQWKIQMWNSVLIE